MAATWSDNGKVYIWDLMQPLHTVDSASRILKVKNHSPVFIYSGHRDEGYAMAWSGIEPGFLLNNVYCERISCGFMY